jgi:hypothetical protein
MLASAAGSALHLAHLCKLLSYAAQSILQQTQLLCHLVFGADQTPELT